MDLHPDFSDLLAELVRFEVSYAVVGGYAVGVHAKPRATKDLDVLVSGDGENLARLADALTSFGAPPNVVASARTMRADEVLYMGVPPVRIDILRSADGIDTEAALARAVSIPFGASTVRVLAKEDLIANKLAAGRPQDLADVAALRR